MNRREFLGAAAAAGVALSAAPDAFARRFGGLPVALVTADIEGHVAVVRLTDAGVEHELVVYDGAPHSFFDRKQEQFADASADAWSRVLAFIERYSASS